MIEGVFSIEYNRPEALLQEIELAREQYHQLRHMERMAWGDGPVSAARSRLRRARNLRFDLVRHG